MLSNPLSQTFNWRLNAVKVPPIPDFKAQAASLRPVFGDIFDMTQAVPLFPTFNRICDSLAVDLKNPASSFYTEVPGLKALREAWARTHPLREAFSANNVLVTSGANHAMYTALTLLFNAGDNVLLLEPFYFNHEMALQILCLQPEYLPLDPDGGFQMLADRVIEKIEKTGARGVILVSPNNPTGACYAVSEIARLLSWTGPRGVQVIIDETYLFFDPHHLDTPDIMPFLGNGLVLLGSFSKVFSLTGYRVGYLIGSLEQIREACKIQDTMIICPSHLSQRAALHGLSLCSEEADGQIRKSRDIVRTIIERCSVLKGFKLLSVGAFFAYFRHPFNGLDATAAALRLYEGSGILGLPGTAFGLSQGAFVRLAFGNIEKHRLDLAISRLISFDEQVVRFR